MEPGPTTAGRSDKFSVLPPLSCAAHRVRLTRLSSPAVTVFCLFVFPVFGVGFPALVFPFSFCMSMRHSSFLFQSSRTSTASPSPSQGQIILGERLHGLLCAASSTKQRRSATQLPVLYHTLLSWIFGRKGGGGSAGGSETTYLPISRGGWMDGWSICFDRLAYCSTLWETPNSKADSLVASTATE